MIGIFRRLLIASCLEEIAARFKNIKVIEDYLQNGLCL